MKWDICCLPSSKVLQVRAYGIIDQELIEAMSREFLSVLLKMELHRSLIDLTEVTPQLAPKEIHELPVKLAALGMRRTCRVALLSPVDSERAKQVRSFGELAGKHGYQVRVFSERSEALAWLSGLNHKQCSMKTATHHYSQCFDAMLDPPKRVTSC